jgi:hypothetical protein
MTDDLITTSDASEITGYHPERLRELIREGKIEGRFGAQKCTSTNAPLTQLSTKPTAG